MARLPQSVTSWDGRNPVVPWREDCQTRGRAGAWRCQGPLPLALGSFPQLGLSSHPAGVAVLHGVQ